MVMDPGTERPVEATEGEYIFSLRPILQIIWRRLWILLAVPILLTAGVVNYNLQQTPQYTASINVLIGQEGGIVSGPTNQAASFQDLTGTMAILAYDRSVAEAAIQEQDLQITPEELIGGLNAEALPESQVVQVSYTGPDAEAAAQTVNAFGEAFSERIARVTQGSGNITATIWTRAQVPGDPVSPQPLRNGAVALAIGLALGLGLVFLVEFLDDSWRSPEEAEQISGVPTFGVIPEFTVQKAKEKA